jgi:hypothetical protein
MDQVFFVAAAADAVIPSLNQLKLERKENSI